MDRDCLLPEHHLYFCLEQEVVIHPGSQYLLNCSVALEKKAVRNFIEIRGFCPLDHLLQLQILHSLLKCGDTFRKQRWLLQAARLERDIALDLRLSFHKIIPAHLRRNYHCYQFACKKLQFFAIIDPRSTWGELI